MSRCPACARGRFCEFVIKRRDALAALPLEIPFSLPRGGTWRGAKITSLGGGIPPEPRRVRFVHFFGLVDAALRDTVPLVPNFGVFDLFSEAMRAFGARRVEAAPRPRAAPPVPQAVVDAAANLGLALPTDLATVTAAYRRAASDRHPDHGGTATEFADAVAAKNILTRFLGG